MDKKSENSITLYVNEAVLKKKEKSNFLNSAFVVTVLGGLILSALTFGVQCKLNESTQNRLQWEKKLDSMEIVLNEFCDGIPRLISISSDLREREIWIIMNKNKDTDKLKEIRYGDQRNFFELRHFHDKLRATYLNLSSYESLCYKVKVYYKKKCTRMALDELIVSLNNLETCKSGEVNGIHDQANVKYKQIIDLMSQEIEEVQNEKM